MSGGAVGNCMPLEIENNQRSDRATVHTRHQALERSSPYISEWSGGAQNKYVIRERGDNGAMIVMTIIMIMMMMMVMIMGDHARHILSSRRRAHSERETCADGECNYYAIMPIHAFRDAMTLSMQFGDQLHGRRAKRSSRCETYLTSK